MRQTATQREPSDKLTIGGFVFLIVSIVIGIAIGGGDTYSLVAGILMLILMAIVYLVGR